MKESTSITHKLTKFFLWFVLLCYMAVLTKLIIFKKSLHYIKNFLLHQYSWKDAKANMHNANFTPLKTIRLFLQPHVREEYAMINLLGNIIGFIPLGLLLPLLFPLLRTAPRTILCVFLVSFGFELTQLVTMLGVFDVDDLLLNTLGGAIGYLFFAIFRKLNGQAFLPAPGIR